MFPRRVALEHYITRAFHKYVRENRLDVANQGGGWHGSKGADFNIDKPGQQVLERSSVDVNVEYVEARFTVGLPAQGRNILGRQAQTLLTEKLPQIVNSTMTLRALDAQDLISFVECIEDQEELRQSIKAADLLAFVRNGAILPRESGASDLPMKGGKVIPFQSPKSLEKSFNVPNRGKVTGMGIPCGITLIAGGGFHGKSTLLDALQLGVYNHVPGDGREFVVADKSLTKIRAEDGRSITSVNISPFISNLPFGQGTEQFSTADASGSTSMAANIQEALELGCNGFLFDEDTCATNFLIRDLRMQMLVSSENEPITPLISKIRSLYTERGCSSILVVGGCGSYLDVADLVVSMDSYVPRDVTTKAKEIAKSVPVGIDDGGLPYGPVTDRIPAISLTNNGPTPMEVDSQIDQSTDRPPPQPAGKGPKSAARRTNLITVSGVDVDLSALEQLVHPSQARAILDAILHLQASPPSQRKTMRQWVEEVDRVWSEKGMDALDLKGWKSGELARPRRFEVAAALNRLRGLRVEVGR
ncbi:hypothetical protein HDV00_005060 [Rhizophlyctis rosea]|nr:hypothetical protein HDV00_005060 [Rhizophlyctis rosea]